MSLSPSRRAACLHTYFNAFLWGLGSSLASAHLLRYLVRDLCLGQPSSQVYATVAWIIAAPRLIGVLRLFAPALIKRMGHRKKFCIAFLLAAPIVMAALPLLLPGLVLHAKQTEQIVPVLVLLVVFWCLHHLLEYFGTIALVSWLGDLVPQRIRGRFLGWREAWLIAGMTLGMTALAAWSYFVIDNMPDETARWEGYLLPAKLGIISLLCSPLPLFFVPHVKPRNITQQAHKIRWDARFAWFVLFGCWVQMSQALTQGVQYGFSMNIVGISLLFSMLMSTETRVGQWLAAPLAGKWTDKLGTAPVMMFSLILASGGSLFYYFADQESWWLLFGASTVWIFWVGVNIGITKTILDLAPPEKNADYLAIYFALTTLTFGLFTLFGGHFTPRGFERASFLVSFELRLLAVPMLWFVYRQGQSRCKAAENTVPRS